MPYSILVFELIDDFIMELIFDKLSLVLPAVACLYFDLFDGILQAFIFVLLTTLYISEEVEEEH